MAASWFLDGLLHHREELCPGADFLFEALGQRAADLREVRHVMRGPGCEKLADRDDAERGVRSLQFQLRGLQIEFAEMAQVLTACSGELVEQEGDRLAFNQGEVPLAIKWLERARGAVVQDDAQTRQPIDTIGVRQVPDDHARIPGAGPFIRQEPRVGEVAQQCIQSGGRAL